MKFKKSKEIYVLPIIFMILFMTAVIVMLIYLKENDLSIRIPGILIPGILQILVLSYLIYLLTIPNILIEVDNEYLKYKNYEIPLKDIDYTMVRKTAFSMYHPLLIIMLKNKETIKIRFLADPYETSKTLNKKYLKVKGNWVK